MQKPSARTNRQTSVGELGPVIPAKMSNDHNYVLHVTSHSIAEYACVYKRENHDNGVFSRGVDNYSPHDRLFTY